MFPIPEFTSQLPLVPDPQLLGPGTKYRHIQQVTENQGFYQIQKRSTFIQANKKLGVRCTLKNATVKSNPQNVHVFEHTAQFKLLFPSKILPVLN